MKAKVKLLRYLFVVVIVVLGVEMIFNGGAGRIYEAPTLDDQRIEIIIGQLSARGRDCWRPAWF